MTAVPRQCVAFGVLPGQPCGRDTHTVVQLGLADRPDPREWTIHVEVPICHEHQPLLTAIEEEAEPAYAVAVDQLPFHYVVLRTLRISVGEAS